MTQRQDVKDLAHYLQVHLTGAAGGIELFGIASHRLTDPSIAKGVKKIHGELKEERSRLLRMAREVGGGDSTVFSTLARVGAQVARLSPSGGLTRNAFSDLLLLETMRDAVAGKIAGWHTLLSVTEHHPELHRAELESLLELGESQHDFLTESHRSVAARVLRPSS